jgi:hypothetical protein
MVARRESAEALHRSVFRSFFVGVGGSLVIQNPFESESLSGSGFEIALQSASALFVGDCDVGFQLRRQQWSRRLHLAGIV